VFSLLVRGHTAPWLIADTITENTEAHDMSTRPAPENVPRRESKGERIERLWRAGEEERAAALAKVLDYGRVEFKARGCLH
jgi:hypothetical protein